MSDKTDAALEELLRSIPKETAMEAVGHEIRDLKKGVTDTLTVTNHGLHAVAGNLAGVKIALWTIVGLLILVLWRVW